MRLRSSALRYLISFIQHFGMKLRTSAGGFICRAIVIHWRGNIHVVGLPNNVHLRLLPVPQPKLSYWRQSIAWEEAQPPDYLRNGKQKPLLVDVVCHVVICHLPPRETEAVFNTWKNADPDSLVVIAYGGKEENFRHLSADITAIFISDVSLRSTEHVRQRQQYAGIIRGTSQWLEQTGHINVTHIHMVEFDVLPTIANPGKHLVRALSDEDADLIGYGLVDISHTIHPHNRFETANSAFLNFLKSISLREEKGKILSMLGCSSTWTRACFEEVARLDYPAAYLEICIPTLTHHLGYRVRPIHKGQERFVTFHGDFHQEIEKFRHEGAWLVHPCKNFHDCKTLNQSPLTKASKLRLLLCGHTYGAAVNRAKATALSEWFEVIVCSPDFKGIQVMGRDGTFQEREIPNSPYKYHRLHRWPRKAHFTRCFLLGLGDVFKQWKPDIVLCEEEPWSLVRWQSWFYSRLQQPRPDFFEFTWENQKRRGLKGRVLDVVYRLAAATTDGVICGNKGAKDLMLKAGVSPANIMRTGQLGVNPLEHPTATAEERLVWREELQLEAESFVVGFCGRFVEEKGILDLLAAVEAIRKSSRNCCLVLLGAGQLETYLKEQAISRQWLKLLPPVDHLEVPHIINRFDLFVLPSKPQHDVSKGIWAEQFGHVLIEAMMCGVPCVGSNSGGIPEVLTDPSALFQPGNIEEITRKISMLIDEPEKLQALAVEQREQTHQLWTHETLAKRYADFLLCHIKNANYGADFAP